LTKGKVSVIAAELKQATLATPSTSPLHCTLPGFLPKLNEFQTTADEISLEIQFQALFWHEIIEKPTKNQFSPQQFRFHVSKSPELH
jgi:hypothetical protein